jgi:hypothetical protein
MGLNGRGFALRRWRSVGVELGKLGREMLVIPAQLWMALAELAGALVLTVWRRVAWPLLATAGAIVRGAYRLAARHVTPARAVAVVTLATLVSLAASQWLDYRGISVGTDDYAGGVGVVAPAPEVGHVRAGDAHSWVMLPIAVAGLVCLALALLRRPALARLLGLLGIAVIAIAVLVDVPKGLDEGNAAVAYQGAEAHLLGGFWLQILAGSLLIFCGLLLPPYMRPARSAAGRPRRGHGLPVRLRLRPRSTPEARA